MNFFSSSPLHIHSLPSSTSAQFSSQHRADLDSKRDLERPAPDLAITRRSAPPHHACSRERQFEGKKGSLFLSPRKWVYSIHARARAGGVIIKIITLFSRGAFLFPPTRRSFHARRFVSAIFHDLFFRCCRCCRYCVRGEKITFLISGSCAFFFSSLCLGGSRASGTVPLVISRKRIALLLLLLLVILREREERLQRDIASGRGYWI